MAALRGLGLDLQRYEAFPDVERLRKNARGIETWFDPKVSSEPEVRRYLHERSLGLKHRQAGDVAGEIGKHLIELDRAEEACLWLQADVSHQLRACYKGEHSRSDQHELDKLSISLYTLGRCLQNPSVSKLGLAAAAHATQYRISHYALQQRGIGAKDAGELRARRAEALRELGNVHAMKSDKVARELDAAERAGEPSLAEACAHVIASRRIEASRNAAIAFYSAASEAARDVGGEWAS
jgi:hypothetical protein